MSEFDVTLTPSNMRWCWTRADEEHEAAQWQTNTTLTRPLHNDAMNDVTGSTWTYAYSTACEAAVAKMLDGAVAVKANKAVGDADPGFDILYRDWPIDVFSPANPKAWNASAAIMFEVGIPKLEKSDIIVVATGYRGVAGEKSNFDRKDCFGIFDQVGRCWMPTRWCNPRVVARGWMWMDDFKENATLCLASVPKDERNGPCWKHRSDVDTLILDRCGEWLLPMQTLTAIPPKGVEQQDLALPTQPSRPT